MILNYSLEKFMLTKFFLVFSTSNILLFTKQDFKHHVQRLAAVLEAARYASQAFLHALDRPPCDVDDVA